MTDLNLDAPPAAIEEPTVQLTEATETAGAGQPAEVVASPKADKAAKDGEAADEEPADEEPADEEPADADDQARAERRAASLTSTAAEERKHTSARGLGRAAVLGAAGALAVVALGTWGLMSLGGGSDDEEGARGSAGGNAAARVRTGARPPRTAGTSSDAREAVRADPADAAVGHESEPADASGAAGGGGAEPHVPAAAGTGEALGPRHQPSTAGTSTKSKVKFVPDDI